MVVLGIALLAGAVVLAPVTYRALRGWLRPPRLPTRSPLRPSAVRSGLGECAGEEVAVAGIAAPGHGGVLGSRLARVDCVWHGHEVRRHYWQWRPDSDTGERRRERLCDSIADYASTETFRLVDAGRSWRDGDGASSHVSVDPTDAHIEDLHICLQRVVGRPQPGVPAPADDLLGRVKGQIMGVFRGETIEFEYLEWVIRPGDPVVVWGRVESRGDQLVLVAPPDGRLRITPDRAREAGTPGSRGTGRLAAVNALLLVGSLAATVSMGLALTFAGA